MNILKHMARLVVTPLLGGCLLAISVLSAPDPVPTPTPSPIPTLKLNDGRVFHNAQVRKDEDTSLVIRADEGLLKISKASLPPDLAGAYPIRQPAEKAEMVMQPFNPNGPQISPYQPAPGSKTSLRPTPTPARAKGVYKGCTIVSFEPRAFQTSQGCVEIVIRNDTDDPVVIAPGEVICVATNGSRRQGRFFVIDGDTPQVRRTETIPAHGDIREMLTFTNEAIDISYVLWAR
jgi:hypothetical protein